MKTRCFRPIKDTILKANHNTEAVRGGVTMVFQTYQRYNFESKSQLPYFIKHQNERCFRPIKDTILKANHNTAAAGIQTAGVFQTYQRYNFESKSQQGKTIYNLFEGVSDLSKIQF